MVDQYARSGSIPRTGGLGGRARRACHERRICAVSRCTGSPADADLPAAGQQPRPAAVHPAVEAVLRVRHEGFPACRRAARRTRGEDAGSSRTLRRRPRGEARPPRQTRDLATVVVALGSGVGVPLVDPVVHLLLAVVAAAVLGLSLAVALVVVDPVVLVRRLDPRLVVVSLLVVLVVLALVVVPVDLLDSLVARRAEALPPVAAHEETLISS